MDMESSLRVLTRLIFEVWFKNTDDKTIEGIKHQGEANYSGTVSS